ncbi:MAG: ABC transporter ATP-binding protein [Bacteroidota bacterium]
MAHTDQAAIRCSHLRKTYRANTSKAVPALDGIDLEVRAGEVFGLLGRNGAGKTTLLRILTTLILPTSGEVSVLGFDVTRSPLEVRRRICAVLQENAVEIYLSVNDNLRTFARFHGITRKDAERKIDEAVARFGLEEYRTQKVIDMSGGAKRRVQVAKAYMSNSPVVFLDEPTTGMDPITKRSTLEAFREQAEKGRTVFLTTHILQEAEELCDTIALVDRGKIVACGDLAAITSEVSDLIDISITFRSLDEATYAAFVALSPVKISRNRDTMTLSVPVSRSDVFSLIGKVAVDHPLVSLETRGATLEDAYMEILGGSGARRDTR